MAFNFENEDSVNEGLSYAEYTRENVPTVYKESEVHNGHTRIWISFDIDDNQIKNDDKTTRKNLYNWFNIQKQIESWGDSVATFLVNKCFSDQSNQDALEYLCKELIKADVLDKQDWAKTPKISLYIIYRSTNNSGQKYSGQFVLIQNAKIRQARKFRC